MIKAAKQPVPSKSETSIKVSKTHTQDTIKPPAIKPTARIQQKRKAEEMLVASTQEPHVGISDDSRISEDSDDPLSSSDNRQKVMKLVCIFI
jgi:hypothetical protein